MSLFVWIVSAMTVTKVVEGCVYIRRRYYGILPRVGGEFEHSALSPLSLRSLSLALSSNATTLNHLIRLRGSQGIQIWKQRTVVVCPERWHGNPLPSLLAASRCIFFVSKLVTTELYLPRIKNQHVHWVCWLSAGRKNGLL